MLNHVYRVTYDIVTEESAEEGDTADSGYILESAPLREAMQCVKATRTNQVDGVECIAAHSFAADGRVRFIEINNGPEFLTDSRESRTLHIPGTVTPASSRRIARLAGINP